MFGIVGALASIPLFFMPKHLPGTEELRLAKSLSRSMKASGANRGRPVEDVNAIQQGEQTGAELSPSRESLVKHAVVRLPCDDSVAYSFLSLVLLLVLLACTSRMAAVKYETDVAVISSSSALAKILPQQQDGKPPQHRHEQ